MRVGTKFVAAGLLVVTVQATAIPQRWQASASSHPSEALKTYVRNYFNDSSPDISTKIKVARIMTPDGKAEDLVYISGGGWCGTAGCRLLIVESAESTFKVLGNVLGVKLPITVLDSTHHGRPDIGVGVRAVGVVDKEAVLSFNGQKYPSIPTLPPAGRASAVRGNVIMTNTYGSVPLYD